MKKKTNIKLDPRFLYLFIPLLILEFTFHFIAFNSIDIFTILRILLFVTFFSLLITFIATRFAKRWVLFVIDLIVVLFFSAYAFLELEFNAFMGAYYSFAQVGDGAGRIAQYAVLFISNAKPVFWLCILPIPLFLVFFFAIKLENIGNNRMNLIICILAFLVSIPFINLGSGSVSILETYLTFNNKELLLNKIGVEHFLFRDLSAIYITKDEEIIIVPDDPIDDPIDDPVKETKIRAFNDDVWKLLTSEETNKDMATIDSYLRSRSITQYNEMSGVYEDYNFIYFLVESLDYFAIDEQLTPTLYKLYTQGSHFTNHYTPKYSCATGESEMVGQTGLFPYANVCTPNYVADNAYYEALPYLFKNKGYSCLAFHNWDDEFYERTTLLPNEGFDAYYDINDFKRIYGDTLINGWQSDALLIDHVWDNIKDLDKFYAFVITSSMHFPYDEYSYLGEKYLSEINEVHPEYSIIHKRYLSKCMEFDLALENLLNYLEEAGKLENTVLCIMSDHRPYWIAESTLIDYTSIYVDRTKEHGIDMTPFIIYNVNQVPETNDSYCSTLDHVPTIANLFNLNYDPRLYFGNDIYDGDSDVIYPDGSWLNETGLYNIANDEFTPWEGDEYNTNLYVRTKNKVENMVKISKLIMSRDYFAKRKQITIPKSK